MITSITTGGLNTLLRCLVGDSIVFSKIQIGNGSRQDVGTVAHLSNPIMDLPIVSIKVENNYAALKTVIDNSKVTSTFLCTEVAIWTKSQDNPEQEVLYAYGYEPEAEADKITKIGNGVLQSEVEFMAFISEAKDISAVISSSMIFASAAEHKAHCEDNSNPHKVTKAQVGLGNVPNVTTNDQAPTYTVPEAIVELRSGEKMGTAFGKIARAVATFISHLRNSSNPHKVTASQIGAAAASHSHGATDIKSGTLGVPRGGTGKGSWSINRILYASGTSTLSQVPFPTGDAKVLMSNRSGAPYWGTVATTEGLANVERRTTAVEGKASSNTSAINSTNSKVKALEGKSRANSDNWLVLKSWDHGKSLPSPGIPGRLFFKEV